MNVAEGVRKTDSATRLVVRCLGRFRLEDQSGNQLHLRTRKARALLAALALNGRSMSRDTLADLLWSDRGEAQARASLRQTIFELQHFGGEDAPILIIGRDDLAIRRTAVTTDIELIRDASSEGDWVRLLALLGEAEPGLLTDLEGLDVEFDDWLRQEPRAGAGAVPCSGRQRRRAMPFGSRTARRARSRFRDPATRPGERGSDSARTPDRPRARRSWRSSPAFRDAPRAHGPGLWG